MASVFLSYDREDVAKAKGIAFALEKAGHKVWWDRHIKGGAQYSKEIEAALKAVEAVVVLWSEQSVDSAWVRDEAAAGRDSGRLVPVTLDKTEPPLGFRQFQGIDLSQWKGRGRNAGLAQLLEVLDDLGGRGPAPLPDKRAAPRPSRNIPVRLIAALLISVALAATAFFMLREPGSASVQTVLVAAAEPGPAAGSLASDLLVKLGMLQSSHADTLQLVEADSRKAPDFVLKVGSVSPGSGSQANLMLIDNRADSLLWSEGFSAPSGKPADLRQQMAYSAAKVLDCAVEAFAAKGAKIDVGTLKLYLSGCANLSNLLAQDPKAAVAIFEKVAERAPKFEGAWKKLILADLQATREIGRNHPGQRQTLQRRIAEARRFYPDMAETFVAESWLLPPRPVAGWMNLVEGALAKDPNNPEILAYESLLKANVGLMQESLAHMRHAVNSDPLSPSAREALITALLNNGQADAARDELNKLEQLWPGATNVLNAEYAIEFRVGDAAEALKMMRSGQLSGRFVPTSAQAWRAHESYLTTRIAPTPSNKALAISNARALYAQDPTTSWVVTRALSEFGTLDDLIAFLLSNDASNPRGTIWTLFRTTFSPLHRDPRFMQVAARLGLVEYWMQSGKWPDFCSDPGIRYNCKTEAAKLKR